MLGTKLEDPYSKEGSKIYFKQKAKGINQMREIIDQGMRNCLLIPTDGPNYHLQRNFINRNNESQSFERLKRSIVSGNGLKPFCKPNKFLYMLGKCLGIFNFGPLLLLQYILVGIKDIVFYCSLKWALAMFVFPLWFLLVLGVSSLLINIQWGFIVVSMSIFMLYLRQYLIKRSNIPH